MLSMNRSETNVRLLVEYWSMIVLIVSTKIYPENTMSSEKSETAAIVKQQGFSTRGLHFVVEKEKSLSGYGPVRTTTMLSISERISGISTLTSHSQVLELHLTLLVPCQHGRPRP
ncbi:hypothetical protein BRADI_2g54395v3 [Brachypodium distachyon]|uniref:Uncharacterized protein n=1 Tax=Brachypodium distachyon TaxID=15368 RepID=A0A2K2DFW7_BRADI|nr:hypothetical protein BRADI_2g54395v3 [Brachypodium distachyon]